MDSTKSLQSSIDSTCEDLRENFRFFLCVCSVSVSLMCQIPKMWHTRSIHVYAGCWHIWQIFVVCFDKLLFNRRISIFSYNSPFTSIHSMKDFPVWLYFAILQCWFSDIIMPSIAKYSASNLTLTWGFTFGSCIPISDKPRVYIVFCLCSYYLNILNECFVLKVIRIWIHWK